jgi:hypothetical protein
VKHIESNFPQIKEEFPKGFVAPIYKLVVTSQNTGMFFEKEKSAITSDDYLKEILANCDGDMHYIMYMLRSMNQMADAAVESIDQNETIGSYKVKFISKTVKHIFGFPKNEYKSKGHDQQIREEGIRDNYTYIDSDHFKGLFEIKPDSEVIAEKKEGEKNEKI